VQDAERRAEEAERRARDARQGASEGEPSWVVQRDEINLTDTELGRGGWAVVQVAEFRGVHCAAKCLYKQIISDYNRRLFIREINMAARVRHPNLLQFIGATLEGELIILTELMPTSVRADIFRMVENCPHLRLHSFKSKRGCHPHKWMAYNLQAFCFDLVKVACL